MDFIALESVDELEKIKNSKEYVVILKHNTTCPISKGVLQRLQQEGTAIPQVEAIHVLDLLAHRDVSDTIAQLFEVKHESPQLLVVKDGQCVYTEWGFDISASATAEALAEA